MTLELEPPEQPGAARRIVERRRPVAPQPVTAPPPAPVAAATPDPGPATVERRTAAVSGEVLRDYMGRVIELENTAAATDAEVAAAVADARAGLAVIPTTDPQREAFVPARLSAAALRTAYVAAVDEGGAPIPGHAARVVFSAEGDPVTIELVTL